MEEREEEGYLTDESSFYGDDDLVASLEDQVLSFSPSAWWSDCPKTLTAMAEEGKARNALLEEQKPKTELHNLVANKRSARRLSETINEFLARLMPSKSPRKECGEYIWISNPYTEYSLTPQEDWAGFREGSTLILEQWSERTQEIERETLGRPQSIIKRAQTKERQVVEQSILALAKSCGCTCGKWMLFVLPEQVDEIWAVVAKAVAMNDLGHVAKVATVPEDSNNRESRLICVSTLDFSDLNDVKRVLNKLKELGLVTKGQRGAIYYKCDAWTNMDLYKGNEWGFKPWLYSSAEVLA